MASKATCATIKKKSSTLIKDDVDDVDDENTIIHYSINHPKYTVQIKQGLSTMRKNWDDLPSTNGKVDASVDLSVTLMPITKETYYCPNASCDKLMLQTSNQAHYCVKCCMVFHLCPVCVLAPTWLKLVRFGSEFAKDTWKEGKYKPKSTALTGPYIDPYTQFDWACHQCRGRFESTDRYPCRQVLWKTGVLCEQCETPNMSGSNQEGYTCASEKCKIMNKGKIPLYKFDTDEKGAFIGKEAKRLAWKNSCEDYKTKRLAATASASEVKVKEPTPKDRKRKDINNELFTTCKKVRYASLDYKSLLQKMRDEGQVPITLSETKDELCFACPKDNEKLHHHEEGYLCYKCHSIYHGCDTCNTCNAVEWTSLTGWQKQESCLPPKYQVVLTPMKLPPYVPERDPKSGKTHIDDSTIFHWFCPMCQSTSTTRCD
jgi:hypothetical protein